MKERLKQAIRARLSNERNQEGITLIELLAVIVILAVIAAIAVPVVLGSISKSKVSVTQQNMSVIVEALNRYATNNGGKYPSTGATGSTLDKAKWVDITTVTQLTNSDPNNNNQPYLKVVPNDGWGNHFYYSSDGTGFILHTADNSTPTSGGNALSPSTNSASDLWWENTSMATPSNNTTIGGQ
jgi:type II secretion system protein G